jgi:hypothetical protein
MRKILWGLFEGLSSRIGGTQSLLETPQEPYFPNQPQLSVIGSFAVPATVNRRVVGFKSNAHDVLPKNSAS